MPAPCAVWIAGPVPEPGVANAAGATSCGPLGNGWLPCGDCASTFGCGGPCCGPVTSRAIGGGVSARGARFCGVIVREMTGAATATAYIGCATDSGGSVVTDAIAGCDPG